MNYTPTMSEAQAIGLCWLARQTGQPEVAMVRFAIAQLHPLSCGWCEYPLDELLRILEVFNLARTKFEDDRWTALPHRAKGEAIHIAQGNAE